MDLDARTPRARERRPDQQGESGTLSGFTVLNAVDSPFLTWRICIGMPTGMWHSAVYETGPTSSFWSLKPSMDLASFFPSVEPSLASTASLTAWIAEYPVSAWAASCGF